MIKSALVLLRWLTFSFNISPLCIPLLHLPLPLHPLIPPSIPFSLIMYKSPSMMSPISWPFSVTLYLLSLMVSKANSFLNGSCVSSHSSFSKIPSNRFIPLCPQTWLDYFYFQIRLLKQCYKLLFYYNTTLLI